MAAFPTMQDEAAIRQLVKDCTHAWNMQNNNAWGQPFAEDADYRTVGGEKLSGRVAIVQRIFDTQCKGVQLETQIESIRFVRPDVACIEAASQLHNANIPFEKVLSAIVAVKENDAWRIVLFYNAGILRTT